MTIDELLNSLLEERDIALKKLQETQKTLKEVMEDENDNN